MVGAEREKGFPGNLVNTPGSESTTSEESLENLYASMI